MANEDPDSIPEQVRQNRPFFAVLALAVLIAIGAFLFILSMDTESTDVGRTAAPAVAPPAAETPAEPAAGTGAEGGTEP